LKRSLCVLLFGSLLVYADHVARRPLPGFSRVRFSIRGADGRPTGVRLRVTNAAGQYFAPLGHLPTPESGPQSPGDLILGDGQETPLTLYALVYDGADIDLPPGSYNVEARQGFERDIVHKTVQIEASSGQTIPVSLRRFENFEARGWVPGDTHVHFPNPAAIRYEMECEGLRVVSLLLLKRGLQQPARPGDGVFQNVEHFSGTLSPESDATHLVQTGEEFRNGLLAHLIFQGLKSIVWPVSTGGLRENGAGGYDWPLMLHASDEAHSQGALVTWAHWPYPSLEAPLDIALGRIDSIDLLTTGSPFVHHPILVDIYKMHGPRVYSMAPVDVYYQYLNCGFHLAMSSGSDKMAIHPPMGSARTYARVTGPVTYASWLEEIRKGHTFATDYPLLEFSVNDKLPGDALSLPAGKVALKVKARAVSLEPYETLEIIYNGKVIRSAKPSGEHFAAAIDDTIEVDHGGWIAARAHGPKMLPYGATWWQMPVFAHSSPIYLDIPGRPAPAAESARLFLDQLSYLRRWADEQAHFPTPEDKQEALGWIKKAENVYLAVANRHDTQ
jgi:hypothetical protein